jgi:hypothetical protein
MATRLPVLTGFDLEETPMGGKVRACAPVAA